MSHELAEDDIEIAVGVLVATRERVLAAIAELERKAAALDAAIVLLCEDPELEPEAADPEPEPDYTRRERDVLRGIKALGITSAKFEPASLRRVADVSGVPGGSVSAMLSSLKRKGLITFGPQTDDNVRTYRLTTRGMAERP